MEMPAVLKAISEYGILIIISAVFIYAAIKLVNVFVEWLKGTVGGSHRNHKKHNEAMNTRDKISNQVQYNLEKFLEEHDGTRVQVLEFSNSVQSVAYLPFKYMTCTYEVCQMGVPSQGSAIDKLSTSLFSPFFNEMLDCDVVVLNSRDMSKKYGRAIYDLIDSSGECNALCVMMYSTRGKAIGCLIYRKDKEFQHDEYEESIQLAARISALLGVMDK